MKNTSIGAGKLNVIESRSAVAGGTLYVHDQSMRRKQKACDRIIAALEEFTPTQAEADVIRTSLKLLRPNKVMRPALESAYFENLDPNMEKETIEGNRGRHGEHFSFFSRLANGDILDSTVDQLENMLDSAAGLLTKAGGSIKKHLEDFYDARAGWLGNLVKQMQAIPQDSPGLDGGEFVNTWIHGAIAGYKFMKTYDRPIDRLVEISRVSMKQMIIAEELKATTIDLAKALGTSDDALNNKVNALIEKIRKSAYQKGDLLIWTDESMCAQVQAKIARGSDSDSIVPTDFDHKTIELVKGEHPSVSKSIRRATTHDHQVTLQYVAAAQQAIDNAIKKNEKDLANALSNFGDNSEVLTQDRINGVKALVFFAGRVLELIAMNAQQSYYDAAANTVLWIKLSARDGARVQKREQAAQAEEQARNMYQ